MQWAKVGLGVCRTASNEVWLPGAGTNEWVKKSSLVGKENHFFFLFLFLLPINLYGNRGENQNWQLKIQRSTCSQAKGGDANTARTYSQWKRVSGGLWALSHLKCSDWERLGGCCQGWCVCGSRMGAGTDFCWLGALRCFQLLLRVD